MLQEISIGFKEIDNYVPLMGKKYIFDLRKLARELNGLKILYINSTPFGGGVAELLSSYMPLLKSLGISAEWRTIYGDQKFFSVTKKFHNALQGARIDIKQKSIKHFLNNTKVNAAALDCCDYDVIIVNDPQPAALIAYSKLKAKWIWRAHIDMSAPDPSAWDFFEPFIEKYDAAIFTMAEFIPDDLNTKTFVIAPAIDINNTKNMELPNYLSRAVLKNSGVDITKPIMLQVSRFDPWKDPLGVINTYRLVKKEITDIQLIFAGSLAFDDPEGWKLYAKINEEAVIDPDMYIYTNQTSTGSLEINAFQRASDIIIQKSIKEGFGLVVSESLWKSKPVIAGRAGGIKLQMTGPLDDYLTETDVEAAKKIIYLLNNPKAVDEFAKLGKEQVRRNFLMPRLIKEELELIKKIVS